MGGVIFFHKRVGTEINNNKIWKMNSVILPLGENKIFSHL